MKIVIINGSPRKSGVTNTIHKNIKKELENNGADVVLVNLCDIKMQHCMGCMSCFKCGHCHLNDDVDRISREIESADGLVLGTPTYVSNVSGLMKDFIDRGHFVMEQMLHGKKCITVTTGINYGKKDANKILKRLIVYSGGYVSSRINFNIPFNDTDQAESESKKKCTYAANKLIKNINKDRKVIIQYLFNLIVFHIGIKPFVYRNREKYSGVIEKWKRYGLIK